MARRVGNRARTRPANILPQRWNSQLGFTHAGGYVAPAVEHSPNANVVAFDVKHEIGKTFHVSAPQSGKGKFLRIARRPEARTVGDRPTSGLKRLDDRARRRGPPRGRNGRRQLRHPDGPARAGGPASRSLRFGLPHPIPEAVEIGIVGSHCRRRRRAVEQQIAQALPILVGADQLPNIFASGAVSAPGDLLVDEGFQRIRLLPIAFRTHRRHGRARPAIHAEAPRGLVPHRRGPQQEPANAKVFGLW
jgi:hypothetical protein